MTTNNHKGDYFSQVQPEIVGRKLEELMDALHQEPVTPAQLHHLQRQFIEAVHAHPTFRQIDAPLVVCGHAKNQRHAAPNHGHNSVSLTFRVIVSLLIIGLGFAMIVLPQPESFEMYTLFLFNEQDGFTLMDLISLLIVFTGIYFLVTAVYKNQRSY